MLPSIFNRNRPEAAEVQPPQQGANSQQGVQQDGTSRLQNVDTQQTTSVTQRVGNAGSNLMTQARGAGAGLLGGIKGLLKNDFVKIGVGVGAGIGIWEGVKNGAWAAFGSAVYDKALAPIGSFFSQGVGVAALPLGALIGANVGFAIAGGAAFAAFNRQSNMSSIIGTLKQLNFDAGEQITSEHLAGTGLNMADLQKYKLVQGDNNALVDLDKAANKSAFAKFLSGAALIGVCAGAGAFNGAIFGGGIGGGFGAVAGALVGVSIVLLSIVSQQDATIKALGSAVRAQGNIIEQMRGDEADHVAGERCDATKPESDNESDSVGSEQELKVILGEMDGQKVYKNTFTEVERISLNSYLDQEKQNSSESDLASKIPEKLG
jgi:hypothetical protein